MKLKIFIFIILMNFLYSFSSFKTQESVLIKEFFKYHDKKEYKKMIPIAEKLCKMDHPYFCYMGGFIVEGTGGDIKKANNLYKMGCEIKINESDKIKSIDNKYKKKCCLKYAIYLEDNKNFLKSRDILENLCNDNSLLSCAYLLGKSMQENDKKETVKWLVKSIKIYEKLSPKEKQEYSEIIENLHKAKLFVIKMCMYDVAFQKFTKVEDKEFQKNCQTVINSMKQGGN